MKPLQLVAVLMIVISHTTLARHSRRMGRTNPMNALQNILGPGHNERMMQMMRPNVNRIPVLEEITAFPPMPNTRVVQPKCPCQIEQPCPRMSEAIIQNTQFLPNIPVTAAMPVTPTMPIPAPMPMAPAMPLAPAVPVAPPMPVAPPIPIAPALPIAPAMPIGPAFPMTPTMPMAPTMPIAPAMPMAPVLPTVATSVLSEMLPLPMSISAPIIERVGCPCVAPTPLVSPFLPAASPVSAWAPPTSNLLPPVIPGQSRNNFLRKIPIPPPTL